MHTWLSFCIVSYTSLKELRQQSAIWYNNSPEIYKIKFIFLTLFSLINLTYSGEDISYFQKLCFSHLYILYFSCKFNRVHLVEQSFADWLSHCGAWIFTKTIWRMSSNFNHFYSMEWYTQLLMYYVLLRPTFNLE